MEPISMMCSDRTSTLPLYDNSGENTNLFVDFEENRMGSSTLGCLSPPARKHAGDAFPMKLHNMLEDVARAGETRIISWDASGESFTIYEPKLFAQTWMRRCFNQSKYKSFQRQLNLYNFFREPKGKIKGVCKY
jgi:hypothetical protein